MKYKVEFADTQKMISVKLSVLAVCVKVGLTIL